MKSTIKTEGGVITIEAHAGRVETNGVKLLPHEARLVAFELDRAAEQADMMAAREEREARKARVIEGAERYHVSAEEKRAAAGIA